MNAVGAISNFTSRIEIFERAGAELIDPSCGACINAGPGASPSAETVTVSTQNRNFPGRSGQIGAMRRLMLLALAGLAGCGEPVEDNHFAEPIDEERDERMAMTDERTAERALAEIDPELPPEERVKLALRSAAA